MCKVRSNEYEVLHCKCTNVAEMTSVSATTTFSYVPFLICLKIVRMTFELEYTIKLRTRFQILKNITYFRAWRLSWTSQSFLSRRRIAIAVNFYLQLHGFSYQPSILFTKRSMQSTATIIPVSCTSNIADNGRMLHDMYRIRLQCICLSTGKHDG